MAFDFNNWDKEMDNNSIDNKISLYQEMRTQLKDGNDSQVLWRLAKACIFLSRGAEKLNDKRLEKDLCLEALGYSEKACKLDSNNKNCHKWYCAAVGKMTKFVCNREKIKFGYSFKQHSDIALRLDPNDFLIHFMSGRWSFEVSSLSWIQRKLAKALYGKIPTSSFDKALKAFLRSNELKPKWKDNYLWIAKVLIAMKKKTEAKQWIENGLALSVNNISDECAQIQLNKLKTKCK
jgi:tetratricopeptide (TPR) repeat protein